MVRVKLKDLSSTVIKKNQRTVIIFTVYSVSIQYNPSLVLLSLSIYVFSLVANNGG